MCGDSIPSTFASCIEQFHTEGKSVSKTLDEERKLFCSRSGLSSINMAASYESKESTADRSKFNRFDGIELDKFELASL